MSNKLTELPTPEQIEKMAEEIYSPLFNKCGHEWTSNQLVQHCINSYKCAYTAALELVRERDAEIERLNKELDIVHECLTELYNYPDNKVGNIAKSYLDKLN